MKPPVFNPSWPEDIQALFWHDQQEIWDTSIAPHVSFMYHEQLRRYRSFAASSGRSLRILDVGCAQATLAILLAEDGHDVVAMDIRPQFLDYARSRYERGRIEFVAANAAEYECTERFDLVFANQIIEHLVYPVPFLKRLCGWLADEGRLVTTTPNARYLMSSLPTYTDLGDPGQYESRQYTADGDGHFFAYTADELGTAFAEAGLKGVRVRAFESPWVSGHMKIRYVQRVLPEPLRRGLDRLTLSLPLIGARMAHQLWAEGTLA